MTAFREPCKGILLTSEGLYSDVFVPADKTKNVYRMVRAQYERLIRENVTKPYKVAGEDVYDEVDKEARVIANGLGIADTVDAMAKRESFLTLKDHKDNFENNLPCIGSLTQQKVKWEG